MAGYNLGAVLILVAGACAAVAAATPKGAQYPGDQLSTGPPLPQQYTPEALADYYSRRPIEVLRRALFVASTAAKVGIGLLSDYLTGW